jgi:aminoglycoside phosphotransferase (APT) family kinase protein
VHNPGDTSPIQNQWIIESFLPGETPGRLSLIQFNCLGSKLARVHAVNAPEHDVIDPGEVTGVKNNLWPYLVWCSRSFYTENQMLHELPDKRLMSLCRKARFWFEMRKPITERQQTKKLLHKDVTLSNLLVQGDEVFLIDWELRDFGDPMVDFATGFWDDIEFNRGKWRIVLSSLEKDALYNGYRLGGGIVDEERIDIFTTYDKLGAAVFLCHRIHSPPTDTTPEQASQYHEDFENIITSLQKHIV